MQVPDASATAGELVDFAKAETPQRLGGPAYFAGKPALPGACGWHQMAPFRLVLHMKPFQTLMDEVPYLQRYV